MKFRVGAGSGSRKAAKTQSGEWKVRKMEGRGILDETLVVYTADHGYMTGHHGLWGKGPAQMVTDLEHKFVKRYALHSAEYADEFFVLSTDPRENENQIDSASEATIIAELSRILDDHFLHSERPDHTVRNILRQPPCNASDRWWPGS